MTNDFYPIEGKIRSLAYAYGVYTFAVFDCPRDVKIEFNEPSGANHISVAPLKPYELNTIVVFGSEMDEPHDENSLNKISEQLKRCLDPITVGAKFDLLHAMKILQKTNSGMVDISEYADKILLTKVTN